MQLSKAFSYDQFKDLGRLKSYWTGSQESVNSETKPSSDESLSRKVAQWRSTASSATRRKG
jgi:hypothetical protein